MEVDLRYPIGKYAPSEKYTAEELSACIGRIASLPERLRLATQGFSAAQLDTPYRDGGWTVRQVIHHVADSHMNAYIRVKWALTEHSPMIKAYDEKGWAVTPETTEDPALSLTLLKSLHAKWVVMFNKLASEELLRDFIHPVTKKSVRIEHLIGMYAWHGDHHLAHITALKGRMKW